MKDPISAHTEEPAKLTGEEVNPAERPSESDLNKDKSTSGDNSKRLVEK